ncbi:MAG: DNA-3-methyladenine glycosylase family protein [Candidatus Limnocylindrales bacterium]
MPRASRHTLALTVPLTPPLDLAASLRPFGRWGDDGIDRWDGHTLVRSIAVGGERAVPFAARPAGDMSKPSLEMSLPRSEAGHADAAIQSVRGTFVTVPPEIVALAAVDERVGQLVALYPGIVPVLVPDPFTALIRSISAQQVNLRWASTIRRRLAERYGVRHEVGGEYTYSLHPRSLATASVEELRAIQLTTAKARSVIACAEAAVAGELGGRDLAVMNDEELISHLTRIRGIGRWSAEWFLARTLGRPRVVAGDLGVRKAVGRLYETAGLPQEEEVRRRTGHWGESATVVQTLALYDLAASEAGLARRRAGASRRARSRGRRPPAKAGTGAGNA